MKFKLSTAAIAAAIFMTVVPLSNANAQLTKEHYSELNDSAHKTGFVNLLISLNADNSLESLSKNRERQPSDFYAEIWRVLFNIQGEYLEKTLWKSRFGQFSVFVTPAGLKKLNTMSNIKIIEETDAAGFINDPENQIFAIREELRTNGVATIRIMPMKDQSNWSIAANGRASFQRGNQSRSIEVSNEFLSGLSKEGIISVENNAAKALTEEHDPTITLTVNHQGFYEMVSRNDIRSIELLSGPLAKSAKRSEWDCEVLKVAEAEGEVSIIIDLKRPAGYTPLLESLTDEARASQIKSIAKAFEEIIGAAEPGALATLQAIEGFASATVTLSNYGVKQLFNIADPRIQRVKVNRPRVQPSLSTSTSGFGGGANAQYIRTFGARGAGQWLAILDTGVQRNHPVLAGKYVAEACFGTNGSGFKTMCPQPNSSGDSAYLLPDSSLPCGTNGNFFATQKCSHGTKMAHIAGGRATGSNFGNFDGMAPDADFFFVNVYSKPSNGDLNGISAFDYDIAAGLAFVNQLRNDFPGITINLSSGGGSFATNCPGTSAIVHDAINRLYQRNVAVVAPTGNDSLRNGINFPACVANTIKVGGSVTSSGAAWSSSNFYFPSQYTGRFFLAPSQVTTAVPNDAYGIDQGTSQSAAHISGAFALIKSVAPNATILEVANLLRDSHSVETSVPLAVFGGTDGKWRRLRFN